MKRQELNDSFEVVINPNVVSLNENGKPNNNSNKVEKHQNNINDLAIGNYYEIDNKYISKLMNKNDNDSEGTSLEKRNNSRKISIEQIDDIKGRNKDKSIDVDRRKSFRMLNKEELYEQQQLSKESELNSLLNQAPPNFECKCYVSTPKEEIFSRLKIIDYTLTIRFDDNIKNKLPYQEDYYNTPLNSIAKVTENKIVDYNQITIATKDLRQITFKIPINKTREFLNIINLFAFPRINSLYTRYARYYYKTQSSSSPNIHVQTNMNKKNGWEIYDIEKEFTRQKIDVNSKTPRYRFLDNSSFNYCSTYPKKLVVPSSMSDNDIKICGSFRTRNRFPSLTYQFPKNKRCIWRSSQSRGGVTNQKCMQDVKLLTQISEVGKKLLVYDARPFLNAIANQLKGNGYENKKHYPKINMEVIFCDMPNIHSVRYSINKLITTVVDSKDITTNIFSAVENSLWYEYICYLIKSSFDIANSIKNDCTVLIHCSDGWDRTTQLCVTSQLILEPYYRTLEGFIVLIEKDWLSFGHQFALRCGNYCKETDTSGEEQFSPIFLQWLDALYQLMRQNYTKFEFNFNLILFLAQEIYNGKYGTFLFNCEKEKCDNDAKNKTVSIWTYVYDNLDMFLNPLYNQEENDNSEMKLSLKKIELWKDYFYRFDKFSNKHNLTQLYQEVFNEKTKQIEAVNNALQELANQLLANNIPLSSCSESTYQLIKKYDNEIKSSMNSYCLINSVIADKCKKEEEEEKCKFIKTKTNIVNSNLRQIEQNIQKNKAQSRGIKKTNIKK